LNLLDNSSQPLAPRERVDGATVYKDFTQSIKDAGGSNKVIPNVVKAETQELFDCTVDQLYKGTGARQGDRSTLPKEAQKAYMVNETVAKHELDRTQDCDDSNNQAERDGRIVETVRSVSKTTRKWLPW
jgi:hypothetical protein